MRIHSVNIINLERRTDLAEAQRKTWTALGFSLDEIVFHTAMDGMAYESREMVADAAAGDGFAFFERWYDESPQHWMGIGELACMWSIARLLRHIGNQPGNDVYLYVLADRFLKKKRAELEAIFSELSDFKFLQFRGRVPQRDEGWWRNGWRRPEPDFVKGAHIPINTIERQALKLGDGVLAMTPAGARWMQSVCEPGLPNAPYEVVLLELGNANQPTTEKGVYSCYDAKDEVCNMADYYGLGYQWHAWEGQYPFGTPLGASDISKINQIKNTGTYRDP